MKSRKFLIGYLLLAIFLISLQYIPRVNAQEQGNWWSSPLRLSSSEGKASEAYMATDQYGYVHVFWTEYLPDDRTIIQYSRFDGENWTIPFDIYITKPFIPIGNLSPVVDQQGTLHLLWTEGDGKFIMYTKAPAYDTLSAQKWDTPYIIDIPASKAILKIDSNGVFHILFTREISAQPGVYYSFSEDQGYTWSEPIWLDQDILSGYSPSSPQFDLDENGGLHAAWYYIAQDASGGNWVRYTHSLDGGKTWSPPFTIDKADETGGEVDYQLNFARPVMIVNGQDVLIVWAGGKLHYRHYRVSNDLGRTWGAPTRFMGDLNGQAGDGLVVDSQGRVHFFSQIRYPQGIYHAVWENNRWTAPNLIYLISMGDGDPIGDRIHAHRTFPTIRGGNQIILTFTDPPPTPNRRLFVMVHNLEDIPPLSPEPTPVIEETPASTATPQPIATALPPLITLPESSLENLPNTTPPPDPGSGLLFGAIPSILLTAGVMILLIIKRRS